MKISYVGATHLGICHAIAAAKKNNKVVLYDENVSTLNNIKNLKFSFYEPKLLKLFKSCKKNILITNDVKLLNKTDIIYIAKDTPTNSKNQSDFSEINRIIRKVRDNVKKNKIIVILSQVYPGFTEKIKWSKKKIFYQVETLIFGMAMKRALTPEQIILGGYKLRKYLNKENLLYKFLQQYKCPIHLMNYKSAELSKISINLYLISSISLTNTLSEICEKIGANWHQIKKILHKDQRIGKKAYLSPGLGVLSGNLQRDLQNSIKIQKKFNCKSGVLKSFDKNSHLRNSWAIEILDKIKNVNSRIGIFGLTYKENISFLVNSPAIRIINKFKKNKFLLFDPVVKKIDLNLKNFYFENDLKNFFKNSDILMILTPWQMIKERDNQIILSKHYNGKFIIDPYNTLNKKILKKIKIFSMGI